MINLEPQTLLIIILIVFIIGLLVGVERGKPGQF
jgi:hypothetical protein